MFTAFFKFFFSSPPSRSRCQMATVDGGVKAPGKGRRRNQSNKKWEQDARHKEQQHVPNPL